MLNALFLYLTSTPLTMGNGAPVADNQNSLTAGPRVHYSHKFEVQIMSYSYQFRLKIIKLVTEQDYGIREVAKLHKNFPCSRHLLAKSISGKRA